MTRKKKGDAQFQSNRIGNTMLPNSEPNRPKVKQRLIAVVLKIQKPHLIFFLKNLTNDTTEESNSPPKFWTSIFVVTKKKKQKKIIESLKKSVSIKNPFFWNYSKFHLRFCLQNSLRTWLHRKSKRNSFLPEMENNVRLKWNHSFLTARSSKTSTRTINISQV